MPPLLKLVNLIVITPCEFIELSQENYHLLLKSCFEVRENDTKKVIMYKVKRIVNAVNHEKVFAECQRHDISCIAFSGQIIIILSDV